MNSIVEFSLKAAHKIIEKLTPAGQPFVPTEFTPDKTSSLIYDGLVGKRPFMVARLGSTELNAMINTIGVTKYSKNYLGYILGKNPQCWWNGLSIKELRVNAGFFPNTTENVIRFTELMLRDIKEIDVLGSWLEREKIFKEELKNAERVRLLTLEPYWSQHPWSRALEGKKVLVVHPFAKSIISQYAKRELLFDNPQVLPIFQSLKVIPAVQSLGGSCNEFKDWFEALDWMKREIDASDYDVALIGCGAYGLPLAAHVKRRGKKVVHLGGALQLLFGIKGNRWMDENYRYKELKRKGAYLELFNDNWISARSDERPKDAFNVENACYW